MNALTTLPAPPARPAWHADATDDPDLVRAALRQSDKDDEDTDPPEIVPSIRHDGWTPERQRRFLEAIAEGFTVDDACSLVRMSPTSAYALRRRAAGAPFALGCARRGPPCALQRCNLNPRVFRPRASGVIFPA